MKKLIPAILFCAACGTTNQPTAAAATMSMAPATGCDTGCCDPNCCDDPSCCAPGCCTADGVAAAATQDHSNAAKGCCAPGSDCCPEPARSR